MLLRHTSGEVVERSALTINPAKTCQPIGAMYAALGVHNCLPHSHGSQGCCAYHRSTLTRHYREPVMAGTSSFTEGTSVFGGQANLLQAIETMFDVYGPEVIAVHTTCLSETIGTIWSRSSARQRVKARSRRGSMSFTRIRRAMSVRTLPASPIWRRHWSIILPSLLPKKKTGQYTARLGGALRHAGNQVPGTSNGRKGCHVSRYLGRSRCAADRDAPVLSQGRRDRRTIRSAGASIGTLGLGLSASTRAADALEEKCEVSREMIGAAYRVTGDGSLYRSNANHSWRPKSPTSLPTNVAVCWT